MNSSDRRKVGAGQLCERRKTEQSTGEPVQAPSLNVAGPVFPVLVLSNSCADTWLLLKVRKSRLTYCLLVSYIIKEIHIYVPLKSHLSFFPA